MKIQSGVVCLVSLTGFPVMYLDIVENQKLVRNTLEDQVGF